MLGWLKKLRTSSKAEPVATETGDDDAKKEKKLAKSAPALPETNDKKTKSPSSTRKSRPSVADSKKASPVKGKKKLKKSKKTEQIEQEQDSDGPEEQMAESQHSDLKSRRSFSRHLNARHKHDHSEESSEPTDDEAQCEPEFADDLRRPSAAQDDDAFIGDADFSYEGDRDISAALEAGDFSCLSPEDILKEQKKRIASVAELLNVSDTTAGNLLRHFRWKQEILLTRYFENRKEVLRELGNDRPAKAKHGSVARIRGTAECLICADEYPADECTALKACKHTFCNDCWENYLNMKINEGKVAIMTCPGHGCNSFVPEDVVQKLVSEELFAKYVRFVTKSFVEDNNNCTWCPAPNCGNAITADMVQGKIVSCTCGYRFCFTCKNEAHAPASCEEVRAWHAKMKDDSESSHWVGANTKDCPRCKVAVEKNGGCMHMTCVRCSYEWCWLCLKPWKGHNDFYSCNRYEKAQKKQEKKPVTEKKKAKWQRLEEEREKQRLQLQRFMHYYERFASYDNTTKLEKQIKEKAVQRMAALTSDQSTKAEVQFIEKGTDALMQCRSVLKYSYVYAYFLPEESPEKLLFNFLQQELEKTTEALAEILESQGVVRRVEAVDLTRLAQTKKENLLRGVSQGLLGSDTV